MFLTGEALSIAPQETLTVNTCYKNGNREESNSYDFA